MTNPTLKTFTTSAPTITQLVLRCGKSIEFYRRIGKWRAFKPTAAVLRRTRKPVGGIDVRL